MNNSLAVQQVLEAFNLCIRSLLVDANMTHEQLMDHMRSYVLQNISPFMQPTKILYTATCNEFGFSEDFIKFMNMSPGTLTNIQGLRDNEAVNKSVYRFGCHMLALQPKLISFVYSYYTNEFQSIVQLWKRELATSKLQKLYERRLNRVNFLIESGNMSKSCQDIEKEIGSQSMTSNSPRSNTSSSRSSLSALFDTDININDDIICNSKVEPCFDKYNIKNLLQSRVILDDTIYKVKNELLTIKELISKNQSYQDIFDKLSKYQDEIVHLASHMENLYKKDMFLTSNRGTLVSSFKNEYRGMGKFWAYQHEFDLYTMACLEVIVKKSNLNVKLWYDFDEKQLVSQVYDIHKQKMVDVPGSVLLSLIELVGLLGASAPWCNLKQFSVPAMVKWSVTKTDYGEVISW